VTIERTCATRTSFFHSSCLWIGLPHAFIAQGEPRAPDRARVGSTELFASSRSMRLAATGGRASNRYRGSTNCIPYFSESALN
jgi:hypothetical protein